MNIFHHSAKFIEKHKHHHHVILGTLALIIAGAGVYTYRHEFIQAATYTFSQSSWAGGITANTANHTSNQTNWTQYSATSTSIVAGAGGVSLALGSRTIVDDGGVSTFATLTGAPVALAFDTSGNLYTANYGANTVSKITPAGTVTTFATIPIAGATNPKNMAIDASGNLYTANSNTTPASNISKITPDGTITTFATLTTTDNPGSMVFDTGGNLYVKVGDATIKKITPGGTISTFATMSTGGFPGNDLAVDTSDNLYLAAQVGSAPDVVFKITPAGTVTTFATLGATDNPDALAFDTAGNLYVANYGANTVSKVTPGGTLTTFATVGTNPTALAFDTSGNLYTANYGANTVSKITPAGTVTTFATVGANPDALAFDTSGSLYVANYGAGTVTKINASGFETGTYSDTQMTGSGAAASVGLVTSSPATGGTITMAGGYSIHTFTSSGTLQITSGSVDLGYLVVGGGGGGSGGGAGGVAQGGGGGGGGMKTGTLTAVGVGTYTVTIGNGGTAGSGVNGGQGGDSVFSTITSLGGGGGGRSSGPTGYPGVAGGSGGGGGGHSISSGGAGTPGQGNGGGNGDGNSGGGGGGGGGGAGSVGSAGYGNAHAGNGGAGLSSSFSGSSLNYAGGGAGGTDYQGTAGTGGAGGGGATTVAGTDNTGGGGGGGAYSSTPAGSGGSGIVIVRYAPPYATSGTFTSSVINTLMQSGFTTLAYTSTLNGQTITVDARAGNTATPDGTWTAWQTGIASGGSISGLSGKQYFQYRANFSTTNTAVTPTLDSVTVNYTQYATTGDLTSSKYNAESASSLISNIIWTVSGTSGTEIVKFQVRSSPDGTTWSNWCGESITCAGSDYFTTSAGVSGGILTNHPLRIGSNDQYLQYKVFLVSGGGVTPLLTNVTVQYVVNGPPTVSNVTASQGTNSTVTVTYDLADADNTIGNIADVTLQYCTTNCSNGTEVWVDAVTVSGSVGTGVALGTGKSITWTPATDYVAQYKANTQKIRIKADDRDAANNLGYGTSGTFTLDTTAPVVTAVFNSSGAQDVITITATDNSTPEYRLCNTADFSGCASWTSITSGAATPINWTATGAPNAETVYMEVRDAYGNTTAQTLVAPAMPANFDYKDISNTANNAYWEFLSWSLATNITGSTFGSYKLYHSNDSGTTYSLLTTITDVNTNYYRHSITTATSSMQYYKVVAVDTDGDISNYTSVLSDIPNGQGGSDTTPPSASNIQVPVGTLRNTSAQITFTTDELATAQVLYGTTLASACNFGTNQTSSSYVTSQSIYLSNLAPSTLYYFCVKATDVAGNVGAGVDGGTFTTVGGPVITNVTTSNVTDLSANIFWNTSTSSDSYVYYSTSASLASPSTAGSATLVNCLSDVCQHQVGISSLTSGNRYYYYVKSTDGMGNSTIDNNNGTYYNFVTTVDTTPPTITDIATPVRSATAAVVVWTTDEPATSQILWGTTAGDRSMFTTTDTLKSIYHVVTLSSATTNAGTAGGTNALTPETTYYYVVKSADAAGNTTTSAETTLVTPSTGSVNIVTFSVNSPTPAGILPDITPPVITDVKVGDITPFGATVSFGTSEDTVSFAKYGKDTSYGDSAGSETWAKTHVLKLRGLIIGTEYHVKVSAVDKSGNLGTSDDKTFKTPFLAESLKESIKIENIEQYQKEIENTIESILPSLVPPFVSKPEITDITEGGATIVWKTNIKAFPVVGYVEDALYDATKENPYTGEVSDTTEKSATHTISLTGLKQNTKYHVQARAFSLPKVIGKSSDMTFTTKASKIQGSIVERKNDSFTVVWTTDEPTSSIVEFVNTSTGITERKTDDVSRTSHSMKVEKLPSGITYRVNISGINEQGNLVEATSPLSVLTSTDITAPVISGFKVDNALVPGRIDRIQTIVSWTTDEPANGTVYYEEGTGRLDSKRELINKSEALDSYVVRHSVILPNLKPGTIYRLKVTSGDISGNKSSFGPRTIITPRQTESITDIIFKNFEESFKFLRNN
ncbi:MAG: glycine-rich domain-containing protein [Patescibacteria group bacterium]